MSALPVVRSTPRWTFVRRGAVLVGVGIVLLVIGGVIFAGRDALAVAKPAARAAIPGEARFDARAGRYAVLLNRVALGGPVPEIAVAATVCDVTRGDGSTVRVRGARQTASTDSSFALSIGVFDARPGPTTVACDNGNVRGPSRFVVARRRPATNIAVWGLIGGGLLVGAAGAVLVTVGFRRPVVDVA